MDGNRTEDIARLVCKGDYDGHSEDMRNEHRETARWIVAYIDAALSPSSGRQSNG